MKKTKRMMKTMKTIEDIEMFSSDKRKMLFCEKSYFVMKSKVVEIVKEVIACDASPVAMFYLHLISSSSFFPLPLLTSHLPSPFSWAEAKLSSTSLSTQIWILDCDCDLIVFCVFPIFPVRVKRQLRQELFKFSLLKIQRINKDMQLILYSPESLGNRVSLYTQNQV